MAVSVYDDTKLTDQQIADIERYKQAYDAAKALGDREGMDSAHAAAESVRFQAGYSGGVDGSRYIPIGGNTAKGQIYYHTAARLPSYEAQTDAVNKLYDAAKEARLAALKSAFDANSATLEAERAEIPVVYQAQKNAAAGRSELAGRNFNEYAAASGLNTGTAGQAALARSNQLQGDLSALGRQEAADTRALDSKLAQLKIQYQNDIATAVAQGEYERAAALLQEYQRAAESTVTTAQAQANENYRASSFNNSNAQWREQFDYGKEQDELARQQWQEQFDYGKEQDALDRQQWQEQFDYGKEQDAQSQRNWEAQFDYGKSQDDLARQQWQEQFDYGKTQDALDRQQWEQQFAAQQDEADWERRYREALANAQYGAAVPAAGTEETNTEGAPGAWDMENGALKMNTPAGTLYGLFTHTPMSYDEILDRIAAAVKSGQISESAGNYLLELVRTGQTRGYGG